MKTGFQCVYLTWEQIKNTRHIFQKICLTYFKISQTYFLPPENYIETCPENADKTQTPFAAQGVAPHAARICGCTSRTRGCACKACAARHATVCAACFTPACAQCGKALPTASRPASRRAAVRAALPCRRRKGNCPVLLLSRPTHHGP